MPNLHLMFGKQAETEKKEKEVLETREEVK
jgi:hypothetical protein